MVTEPHCQLTTSDHTTLQSMLERYRGPRGPYLQLLEQKVRDSSICFRADVPPDVVTIDTRLAYLVDGVRKGPHQLVHGDDAESLPPFALSIRTVRGLALLGLAEGDSIVVELGADIRETLTVEEILSRPQAGTEMHDASKADPPNVVSFRPRHRAGFNTGTNPDDDDPGPRAA